MMASLETGTLLLKRYEIIQVLGEGDFGIVYQARDKRAAKTNPLVAIKQMPMQMIIDNERQADLRANLVHPNIPRIFGYFSYDNYSYLVQEFICGSDLERVLGAQPGFLAEKTVIA
jgi:eukaryotic-like serine/threonine-protein kinase